MENIGDSGRTSYMGCVTKVDYFQFTYGITRFNRRIFEDIIVRDGSVIQRQEARAFTSENGGSNPSRPTTNILVVKKCQHCSNAMYLHKTDAPEPIFTGCEPCIVDIRLERVADNEMLIKGRRSTKAVRCTACKKKHLLTSFEEVKDGVSNTGEKA